MANLLHNTHSAELSYLTRDNIVPARSVAATTAAEVEANATVAFNDLTGGSATAAELKTAGVIHDSATPVASL